MENVNWLTGIVFPYLNLIIFLILAVKFLKGPLLGMISGKKEEYLQMVQVANSAKQEALEKHEALQKKLNDLSAEVDEIRNRATKQAEQEAEKIIANAHALAKHLKTEAKRIAEAEVEMARRELQDEIIAGVQNKVIEKIQQQFGSDKQKALFLSQVKTLDTIGGNA